MPKLREGQVVGGYTVVMFVGDGGSAEVYRVRRDADGTTWALKVLRSDGGFARKRFAREAQVLRAMNHRRIVAFEETLDVDGLPGVIMEWVPGPNLLQLLADHAGFLPIELAMVLFGQLLEAMQYAHGLRVIHRDLKPMNVLVVDADPIELKVADFGLVKLMGGDPAKSQLTRTGLAMGTIGYMAPEQASDAKRVDQRADIWSLGCLLYQLVCGAAPFSGSDILKVRRKTLTRGYPPPRSLNPRVPDDCLRVIEACLSPQAADRPASVAQLACLLGLTLVDDAGARPDADATVATGNSTATATALGSGRSSGYGGAAMETVYPDDWLDD
jgi:eukaryotic-like serine/threonine-protein kinase